MINDVKKIGEREEKEKGTLKLLTLVMCLWFGLLTLALVVILAVIWKRLRAPAAGHDITTLNDSESAFAESVYNKSSVVDFDGPFKCGKWMSSYESGPVVKPETPQEEPTAVHQAAR